MATTEKTKCHLFSEVDDELGELLDVDDVLGILRVSVDDLGATSDLKITFYR